MRHLIFLISFFQVACSSIPSIGDMVHGGGVTKVWHVNPADMDRFQADQSRCGSLARASRSSRADDVFDYCLQTAGYRLEIQD
jgi:hypothetical protein